MSNERTVKSIRNTFFALCEECSSIIMTFVCRTVFIYTLGKTYLGFNGLFSDILTLLSLGELGIGTAIIYSMYKPASNEDHRQIAALLNLYRKIYAVIGIFIAVIGMLLVPFLDFFISGIPNMSEIPLIYILYLANTASSYFFSYKRSILIVSQSNYILSLSSIAVKLVQNILQIIFLSLTHNFIVYLIIQIVCTLSNNIFISIYVDRHYVFLKKYRKEMLDKQTKRLIFENTKAMFTSKLSSAIVTSTDNILISKFVSTIVLGLYSNYTLFTTAIKTIVTKIFEAITGSVGNLVSTESGNIVYKVFKRIWFFNFWLVSFFCVSLFLLINPFIKLWIGESFLLDERIVFIICLNLYMRLIRNTFLTFNDTYGMFIQLRPKCIAEAIINLIASLILVGPMQMGIIGILLGTFISNITTNFWYEPYLLFTQKFKVRFSYYLVLFFKYILITLACGFFAYCICNYLIQIEGWGGFFIKAFFICIFVNMFYCGIFIKTEEFKYFFRILKNKIFVKR